MDKLDKVVKQKNARRKELCIYYFPRALCCSIFLLFIYALSYRLTDQVILPSSHDRAHHMPRPHLPIGSTSQRSSHETSTSMLLHRRTSDHSVVDSGVGGVDGVDGVGGTNHVGIWKNVQPLNPRKALRSKHHSEHLKEHGNLLMAAKEHGTHQLGPHVPHRHRRGSLTESERQGNIVTHIQDGKGNDNIITDCKEYLGDHVHCKPVLDQPTLRLVQQEYEMSEKLYLDTIAAERKRWKSAWEVGLSTEFMRLRLVEVAHNYQLKRKRPELKKIGDAGLAEQTWRYKHTLRHVNFMSHNKASFNNHLDMERELDGRKRELLAAYAFTGLRKLYLRLGVPKHDTTVQQIVYKYVRRHDLLDALVIRLEKRYKKNQALVAEYMYPVQAGKRALMRGEEWPGLIKKEREKNSTLIVQEEMDAVNWMFKKLREHRLDLARRKEIEKTRKTCIFSHTNEESPCFPTHPCAKIEHGARTRAIIVKCFWRLARPYCRKNQRNAGALVPVHRKSAPVKKVLLRGDKGKKIITKIDGVPTKTTTGTQDIQGPQDAGDKSLETDMPAIEKASVNEGVDEGADEGVDDDDMKKKSEDDDDDDDDDNYDDPYDAEDLDEFDDACTHVLHDTFADGIAWFESQGLRPEWEEREKEKKEKKEKKEHDDEERRKHKFLPDVVKDVEKDESMSLEAKEKEDMLIAALPPAKQSIHALLTKKSSTLKIVGSLKNKLKRWYIKHNLGEKAKDDVHLTALAKKYSKHEDLLFTRLHVKYHQTKD